jgi:hypothetical protein
VMIRTVRRESQGELDGWAGLLCHDLFLLICCVEHQEQASGQGRWVLKRRYRRRDYFGSGF